MISYGVIDPLDMVIGVSYQFLKSENGAAARNEGWGDVAIDLKWKLYERDNLALALKPGITLPTGDEQKVWELARQLITYFSFPP